MAKKITAKYTSRCADCGGTIYAGDKCYWEKGEGVWHADREVCDSYDVQRQEMMAEAYAEARLMGCASSFWENV